MQKVPFVFRMKMALATCAVLSSDSKFKTLTASTDFVGAVLFWGRLIIYVADEKNISASFCFIFCGEEL